MCHFLGQYKSKLIQIQITVMPRCPTLQPLLAVTVWMSFRLLQSMSSCGSHSPGWCSGHSHLLPHVVQEHGRLQQMSNPLHVPLCRERDREKKKKRVTRWSLYYSSAFPDLELGNETSHRRPVVFFSFYCLCNTV